MAHLGVRRTSIIQAEQLLSHHNAKLALEDAKKQLALMVTQDLKDLDFSFEIIDRTKPRITSLKDHHAKKKPTINEIIERVKSSDELDRIKRGIAIIALNQLGALYGQFEDHYDSPSSKESVKLTWTYDGICLELTFDPDPILKDIPALIQKSNDLAKKLQEIVVTL